jgi:hypothetical protein
MMKLPQLALDSQGLALAGANTERIDLEGKTVLPGFYDSHIHIAGSAGEAPDPLSNQMSKTTSIAEVVELVRQKVASASLRDRDAQNSWRKIVGPNAGTSIPSHQTIRSSSTVSRLTMCGLPTVRDWLPPGSNEAVGNPTRMDSSGAIT